MTQPHTRPLGRTGLHVFPLGFGCYRVGDGNAGHEAALRAYLDRGGNLIDTSANYTDGLSEQLVGRVLKEIAPTIMTNERAVIVTKGGYIQGHNMALARRQTFPEVVAYADGLWHCIHPDFLETQIRLSAERLQVETIDVYLLHNPEYFLTEIAHHHPPAAADHDEFYRRIREAFRFLEAQVQEGRIRWYGVSSNHFGLPASDPVVTSVARCLDAAKAVAGQHHFAVVQLPMNLYECGGALEPNTNGQTVLQYCQENGIGVLANRPLNAFWENQLIRLADFVKPGDPPPGPDALRTLLDPLRRLEQQFADRFGSTGAPPPGIAGHMEKTIPQVRSPAHFEQVAGPYLVRPIQQWLAGAQQTLSRDAGWPEWERAFVEIVNGLFESLHRHVSAGQQSTSDGVRSRLITAGYPDTVPPEPLSRMATRVLLSLPGLTSVLVGMRRPAYVDDLMAVPAQPPPDPIDPNRAEKILRAFRPAPIAGY
jgi:aryl-alcohol dehydrogenase-like predicted oxidoreductase